jgi:hypothetical protein
VRFSFLDVGRWSVGINCRDSLPLGLHPNVAVMFQHFLTDMTCYCHQCLVWHASLSQPCDAVVAKVMEP